MIKANKLMIDDIVEYLGEWWKVIEIYSAIRRDSSTLFNNREFVTISRYGVSRSVLVSDLKPIDVTKDLMLYKLKFKEELDNFLEEPEYFLGLNNCNLRINRYSNKAEKDWSVHIDNIAFSTIGCGDFQYLHELQQLVRIIGDEELSIEI